MSTKEKDDFGGIFDITEDQITVDDGYISEKNPDNYTPSLKNKLAVKEGHYKSVIRLVPNVFDRNLNIVPKWIYYLPDPNKPEMNFYIDCPSNFQGKNGKNNIVTNAFFFLKDNESKLLRQMAKSYFSRKRYYFSLAQIMIDEFEPDDEGKILIFRFGKQVYDIIEREKTADPKIKKEAVIPYDPFRGKDFVLWIEEKQIDENRKITSYERSYFDDKLTSMSFDKGEKRVKDTPKNRKLIYEYLKKHSPKLDQCQPKEWDAQTEQRVIASVMSIIGDEKIFDAIYKKTYGKDAVYTPPAKDGDAIEDKTDSKKEVAEETKSEEVKEEVTEETKDNAEKLEDKVAKTTDEKTDAAESKTEETGAAEPEPESTPEPESKEQAGGKPDFDDLDNFDFEKID